MKVNQPEGSAGIYVHRAEISAWPFFSLWNPAYRILFQLRHIIVLVSIFVCVIMQGQSLHDASGALYVAPGTIVKDAGQEAAVSEPRPRPHHKRARPVRQVARTEHRNAAHAPRTASVSEAVRPLPENTLYAGFGKSIIVAMLPSCNYKPRILHAVGMASPSFQNILYLYKNITLTQSVVSAICKTDLDASSCRPPPSLLKLYHTSSRGGFAGEFSKFRA